MQRQFPIRARRDQCGGITLITWDCRLPSPPLRRHNRVRSEEKVACCQELCVIS